MLLVSGHGPMRQQNGDTAYTYVVGKLLRQIQKLKRMLKKNERCWCAVHRIVLLIAGKVGVDMDKEDGRKAAHDTVRHEPT